MSQEQPQENDSSVPLDGSDQFAVRQAKLDQLREAGQDPYRSNWEQIHTSGEALKYFMQPPLKILQEKNTSKAS